MMGTAICAVTGQEDGEGGCNKKAISQAAPQVCLALTRPLSLHGGPAFARRIPKYAGTDAAAIH